MEIENPNKIFLEDRPPANQSDGDLQGMPNRGWRTPAYPVLTSTLARKPANPSVFPFDAHSVSYWSNARAALWQGLSLIGLKPGDRVLAPAYACGTELEVLFQFGLELEWYPLLPSMQIDLDSLERSCRKDTKAIFLIHYFGFPQPMDEILVLVRDKKLLLIEDNAHGLYSSDHKGRPLGSMGDIGIFSLYKSLPVPDGGVLVVNRPAESVSPIPEARAPTFFTTLGKLRLLTERTAARSFPRTTAILSERLLDPLASVVKRAVGWQRGTDTAIAGEASRVANDGLRVAFDSSQGDLGMSTISEWLLQRINHDEVCESRRRNYARLYSQLKPGGRAQALFGALPPECCPLFFPVLQRAGGRSLRTLLRRNSIESYGFGFDHPRIPMARFTLEADLKFKVACLPLHQSLKPGEIDEMAGLINDWSHLGE